MAIKRCVVEKDPLTGQPWFSIPSDYVIKNHNLLASANIISKNFLNICGMFSPTLYIEYDPATACSSIDINFLFYQPKPRNITNLIMTTNIAGAFNPTANVNGMFFSISPGILSPMYFPMGKIQIINNDAVNALNGLSAYIIGSGIPSGMGF